MKIARLVLALVGLLAYGVGAPSVATAAAPVPYPPRACVIGVSTTTPLPGQPITVTGSGLSPNEVVTLTLRPAGVTLAHRTTTAQGAFTARVVIPADVTGRQLIVTSGSGATCPVDPLLVGPTHGVEAAHAARGGGGLAFTGVAVSLLLTVAASLLVVGLLLTVGRRGGFRPTRGRAAR